MTAKIIRLDEFVSGCRHRESGIRFPQVYRVTGFEYDFDDSEQLVPSNRPVEPFYALSDHGDFGIATPTFTPIAAFDPGVDKGWLIVRHHRTKDHLQGYHDALFDAPTLAFDFMGQTVWQTSEGIFNVLHRPGVIGKRDHAISYVTKVSLTKGPFAGHFQDIYHVVYSDGSVVLDPDFTLPLDPEG